MWFFLAQSTNNSIFNSISHSYFDYSKLSLDYIQKNCDLQFEDGVNSLYFVICNKCIEDATKIMTLIMTNHAINTYNRHGFSTKQKTLEYINSQINNVEEHSCYQYYICFMFYKNKAIPVGLIHIYDGTGKDELSFYFCVLTDFQGKKIGTKMAKTIINYVRKWRADKSHKFHNSVKFIKRIETTVDVNNPSSNKVFIRLGFIRQECESISAFLQAYRYTLMLDGQSS